MTNNLTIYDRIYGEINIGDPIVLEIIETSAFQRLKLVNQYGGVNFVFPDKYQVSRFEHSIGVWWILKSLGTSLEVQIAGLLHDVGHAAFSHMVDQAMANELEDYHEKNQGKIEGMDQITDILKKRSITLKPVDEYGEIKKSLPNVGADRIDYAVRDFVGATGQKESLGKKVLQNIKLVGDQIVFTDLALAKDFALTGLDAMYLVIYEPSVAVVYSSIIEIIKQGIKEKWLSEDNLFLDDAALLEMFKENQARIPEKYIKIFESKYAVEQGSEEDFDFHHVKLKSRYFDPFVITNGEMKKLSEIDSGFKVEMEKMIEKFEQRKTGEYYKIKFIN